VGAKPCRARAGGGRDLGEGDPAFRRTIRPGDPRQPLVARHQDGHELHKIHRTAAAEADAGIGCLGGTDSGLEGLRFRLPEQVRVLQPEQIEAGRIDLISNDERTGSADRGGPGGERLDLASAEADDGGRRISIKSCRIDILLLHQATASRRAFWTSGSGSRPAASRRRV